MKTRYTLLAFLFLAQTALAQQLPLFTQYREYAGVINPASVPNDYLWYDKTLSFGASYRRQWVTDKDGPATQVLRGDYVWERGRKGAYPIIGGYLMNDKAGRMGMTGAYARAAVLFTDEAKDRGFSVGLNAGVVRYGLDLSNARVRDINDIALYEAQNRIFPDVGLGAYAYVTLGENENQLFGGVSIPQVIGLNVQFRNQNPNDPNKPREIQIRRVQHYFASAGYRIPLEEDLTFLEFSTWARMVLPLGPQFDFNFRAQLQESFFFGTGFSTNGNAHLDFGLNLGEDRLFRLGVGADFPFSKKFSIATYYGNSYEVNVAYAMGKQ
ncbi:MAG: PorP/SprF family type IX secretion system membrane protein [Polyangiaceae bacterium]|nr:PorP/SprF family type IX secretion system membrane protein [Polyangiaceae bacterium]